MGEDWKRSTIFYKLVDFIRAGDMFGIPVTLNYRGNTHYNTFMGGCMSIILYLIFGVFFVILLWRMVSKSNVITNQNERYLDLHNPDFPEFLPLESGMMFGFYIRTNLAPDLVKYINYTLQVEQEIYNPDTNSYDTNVTVIPLVPWEQVGKCFWNVM